MPRQEYPSLRQGLVGAWCPSLGASGLSLIDRSGRNRHGTLVNMEGQDNWRASGSGLALRFDGTNDYASISPPSISTSRFTLCLWCNAIVALLNYTYKGLVFARGGPMPNGAGIFPGNGGLVSQWNGTAPEYTAISGMMPPTGQWFFAAMVVDGPTITTWLNSSSYSVSITETARDISAPWRIASDAYDMTNRTANVLIDDVRMYSRALNPAEIRLLASRRGIGLTPLPDRAAGLPRKLSVNVGGTWRSADAYVNVGGTWKLGQASTNVAGTWR